VTAEREKLQSYITFIVRDDRACEFLFQCSDATWSAYNRWPSQWALYDDGLKEWYCGPEVRVSWDRPYGKYCQVVDAPLSQGSGEFLLWEFPLAFWMEKEGYDVSYISNVDTHADAKGLLRARAWLSVGHDEYWSLEMFNNVQAAVVAGVNAAFFSGDTCWGLIPFLPNSTGAPHRVITRVGQFGPLEQAALKDFPEYKRFKQFGPSEATLIGARNVYPTPAARTGFAPMRSTGSLPEPG
jgi:N,N-dimethylformamidase beta subunit-like, C-terminal